MMKKRQVVVESSTTSSSMVRRIRYRECQKNHATNIRGYAVDGCREFMASDEQGTTSLLTCAACGCHRNFHRREVETEEMDNFGFVNRDMAINVLSRLPTKLLFGLKCVCKGWHQLLCDRDFTKVQSQKREQISGFFFQQRFQWCPYDIRTIAYIPAEFIGLNQTVFSFLPEDVVVLASCNGLVCCRSCVPCNDPAIYVCNPVNREWIKLNWSGPDRDSHVALAFDPCQNAMERSINFKLVQVRHSEATLDNLYFSFEIYSSDTGVWRMSKEICKCNDKLYKNKGIFIGGVLHWLTDGDNILTFNIENELAWLIAVPLSSIHFESITGSCIGESDGQLYYVIVSEEGLHVWLLQDPFESKWTLKHAKTLEAMEAEHPSFLYNLRERVTHRPSLDSDPWMDPLAFKDGYLLMKVCDKIYIYHVETTQMKQACMLSELGGISASSPIVLPYSLSMIPVKQALE
ncbi:hypothetical protein Q3G72_032713 [Acer saccharum]|nr:hypothetical protein Q3G72_032713 [Acer saccharum]